jgi:ABC-type Mn2+/Zn2+ transport system ATPase subunit
MLEMLDPNTGQPRAVTVASGGCADVPALAVHHLSAGYSDIARIVDDVTFDVLPGERVAIIGPNGAGKSTLFKALVGIIPHTGGEISFHGRDCRSSHDRIGYVPQAHEVDWKYPATVEDVVMMGRVRQLGWFNRASRADWETVRDVLAKVGMAQYAKRPIGALSGGQKQRVFIARALAQQTDVLLLDEPFNGVDANAEDEILHALDLLRSQNIAVIVATHDLEMALTRFDKLLLLRHRLIAFGDPQAVFVPSNLKQAYGSHMSVIREGDTTFVLTDEHGCG